MRRISTAFVALAGFAAMPANAQILVPDTIRVYGCAVDSSGRFAIERVTVRSGSAARIAADSTGFFSLTVTAAAPDSPAILILERLALASTEVRVPTGPVRVVALGDIRMRWHYHIGGDPAFPVGPGQTFEDAARRATVLADQCREQLARAMRRLGESVTNRVEAKYRF